MYTEEAPPFHIWNEDDVHELVCYDKADLKSRKSFGYRRCDYKDCDWCNDKKELKLIICH